MTAMVWVIQASSGSFIMGYSTYSYQQAGLGGQRPFNFTIIQYCLGIIGTLFSFDNPQKSWKVYNYFYEIGTLFCIMFTIGCLGVVEAKGTSWGAGVLLMIFTLAYDTAIDPLCYCIVAGIPSSMVCTKTIIISRNQITLLI